MKLTLETNSNPLKNTDPNVFKKGKKFQKYHHDSLVVE